MDRRAFVLGLASIPVAAVAQNRRFRIGWLVFGGKALGSIDQSLIDALSERGYFDGRNLEI